MISNTVFWQIPVVTVVVMVWMSSHVLLNLIYLFERIWPKCSGDFESIRLVNTRHWRMADKAKLQDQVRAVKEQS